MINDTILGPADEECRSRRDTRNVVNRIETVGGSQPRGVIPTDGGETPEDGPLPDTPPRNDFNETTGSSFTIADGPTTGILFPLMKK